MGTSELQLLQDQLREKVSSRVRLLSEGSNRYRVFTPFRFDDGDRFVIVLEQVGSGWVLRDEGHTLMHLSYRVDTADLQTGNRGEIVSNALTEFNVANREGDLVAKATPSDLGDRFFDYIQALSRIADVLLLSRERVRSTFWEDLAKVVKSAVSPSLITPDWFDRNRDPNKNYVVPYRLEAQGRPVLVFGLPSDAVVQVATISLLKFETWGLKSNSVGIYENQEEIGPKTLARFSDAVGKQFSGIEPNKDRIKSYLQDLVEPAGA
jgi:hypothetical protein